MIVKQYWKSTDMLKKSFVFMMSLFFFLGCSGASKSVKVAKLAVKNAYEIQKPFPVKDSKNDNRPEWTKKTVFANENTGMVYFSGGFLNGSDYSVTIRCANAEALKVAVQAISQFIRAEFSTYVQGSNAMSADVDRWVYDGIATYVNNLHMQGIKQKEVYYEEVFIPAVMQSAYNVWVQLEMSKADYLKAKADVIKKLRDSLVKKGEKEAKEKADKLLDQLKKDIDRELRNGV